MGKIAKIIRSSYKYYENSDTCKIDCEAAEQEIIELVKVEIKKELQRRTGFVSLDDLIKKIDELREVKK